MCDIVLLFVQALVIAIQVVALAPAPGLSLDVLDEVRHSLHQFEGLTGTIILVFGPGQTTKELDRGTGVSRIDVRVPGARR